MPPPDSVPEQYRPGFLPPGIADQMQKDLPGKQHPLDPPPFDDVLADGTKYKAAGKLEGKKAVVTGGDSGIGRSICVLLYVVIPPCLSLLYDMNSKRRGGTDDGRF